MRPSTFCRSYTTAILRQEQHCRSWHTATTTLRYEYISMIMNTMNNEHAFSSPYFVLKDFVNAANCYEQLTILYPDNEDYRIYYAQALYQACLYEEAMKVTVQIENPELQGQMLKLQAAIKYGEEDLAGAKSLVDQCPGDDPDTDINRGMYNRKLTSQ